MTGMTGPTKIGLAFVAVVVAVFGILFALQQGDDPKPVPDAERSNVAVREDSHRLSSAPGDRVVLVEFLDFECEACRAAYPFVEELRERYADQVTFVARYFPLPGHANARNAAHAVEAAARQGSFEQMYQRMYETQSEWGEQPDSQADLFRTFADDLGLNMDQYDRDVASEDVAARVQADVDDGLALGVSGTPTFYLNGQPVSAESEQDFTDQIDTAIAQSE